MKSFPKIFNIGHSAISSLFDGPVEVTEKVDGSQLGFGKIDGKLIIRSKRRIIEEELTENDMFYKAWKYVISIEHLLPSNIFYYAEYLQKPKHNTLEYERVPKNNIMLFAKATIANQHDYTFDSNYDILCQDAQELGVEVVPLLYNGVLDEVSMLESLLNKESGLGGTKIEGVVVKNYNNDMLVGGQYFPIVCGKYVSERFKEVNNKNWKRNNTQGGAMDKLKEKYRTQARWDKAIQHLREKGELTDSPKDIGNLIKEIKTDLLAEEKENIMKDLYDAFGHEIIRHSTKGIAEYYKNMLLKQSFE